MVPSHARVPVENLPDVLQTLWESVCHPPVLPEVTEQDTAGVALVKAETVTISSYPSIVSEGKEQREGWEEESMYFHRLLSRAYQVLLRSLHIDHMLRCFLSKLV